MAAPSRLTLPVRGKNVPVVVVVAAVRAVNTVAAVVVAVVAVAIAIDLGFPYSFGGVRLTGPRFFLGASRLQVGGMALFGMDRVSRFV